MEAKIALTFADAEGKNVKMTYKHIDPEADANDIRTAVQAIVTNGSIFTKVPVTSKSAKLLVTTTTDIELSA